MNSNLIVHISEVDISPNNGMGRVEYNWKSSFEERGFEFIHIGPKEIGFCLHKGLFPYKAYTYFKKLKIKPRALIVHEPASGVFVKRGIPCFVESHGVERRGWGNGKTIDSLITRYLYPIWRLRNCDIGLKNADKLLLINSDDKAYVEKQYNRSSDDIFIFKNGVNYFDNRVLPTSSEKFTVLFNGTWIDRKGIHVLIAAADNLYNKGIKDISYLLIGTMKSSAEVTDDWPEHLRKYITIVERFEQNDEINFLNKGTIFVLPSFIEGQPLSLLQAMSVGKCCISTNCCGQKDIIINGQTGLLFPVGDVAALTELMIQCYKDPAFVQQIGEQAEVSVRSRSWPACSAEVVDYILKYS